MMSEATSQTPLEGYYKGMNYLLLNHPKTAEYAGAIGAPVAGSREKRAAVVLTGGDKIELHVSEKFFSTLTDSQAGTVLAHEFNHVFLNHLHEVGFSERWPRRRVLNLAHEVVINDRLAITGFDLPEDAVTGAKITGESYAGQTTDYAYKSIEKFLENKAKEEQDKRDQSDETSDSEELSSESGEGSSGEANGITGDDILDSLGVGGHECDGLVVDDGDGELRPATPEELQTAVSILNDALSDVYDPSDDHFFDAAPEMEELEDVNPELAKKIREASGTIGDLDSKGGSSEGDGVVQEILSDERISMEWVKLLEQINPDIGTAGSGANRMALPDWTRRPRVLSAIPNVILPSVGGPRDRDGLGAKIRPIALLALDFSGSIPRTLTNTLQALARSIPDDLIEATCVTFSTYIVDFDYKSDYNKVASGCTDFSPIHVRAMEIAKANGGVYPHVLCFTDGQAEFERESPSQYELDSKWIWVDAHSTASTPVERLFRGAYAIVKRQKNKTALPYGA